MFETIVVALIIIAVVYFVQEARISKRNNEIIAWRAYADQLEAIINEYASAYGELADIKLQYGSAILDAKIARGQVRSTKLQYANGNGGKSNVVALDMFDQSGLFAKDKEFAPTFDQDGAIIYAPIVKADDKPKAQSNGNGNKNQPKNKPSEAQNNKPANSDNGMFEQPAKNNRELLKSDKYGELLDLLMAHLNTKKIPDAKYNYVKDMFIKWETGNKPNSAQEYATRIINQKFGGK